MNIETEAAFLRSMLNMHVHSCFRATRGKKEECRQICVRDTMNTAVDLALAAFDQGVDAELCTRTSDNVLGLPPCRCNGGIRQCAEWVRAAIVALKERK